jgi:hypothetical protein
MDGTPERSIQTLTNMTRCFLHDAQAPAHLWGYAMNHAVNVRNVLPLLSRELRSPIEAISGHRPRAAHIQPWGCDTKYWLEPQDRQTKLMEKSRNGIYVGFKSPSIALLVDAITGRFFEHRYADCTFRPDHYPTFPTAMPVVTPTIRDIRITPLETPADSQLADARVLDYLTHLYTLTNLPLDPQTLQTMRDFRRTIRRPPPIGRTSSYALYSTPDSQHFAPAIDALHLELDYPMRLSSLPLYILPLNHQCVSSISFKPSPRSTL